MELRALEIAMRFLDPRQFRKRLRRLRNGSGVAAVVVARAVLVAPRAVRSRNLSRERHARDAENRLALNQSKFERRVTRRQNSLDV